MNLIWVTLVIYIHVAYGYNTNVVDELIWKTKAIDYFLEASNEDMGTLKTLVDKTLTEFNNNVGTLITWKEVKKEEAKRKDRFVIFILDKYDCDRMTAMPNGPTYVPLSVAYDCDMSTNLQLILRTIGFKATHLRADRDTYINIIYDNIRPINHQNYEICGKCMNSSNIAFQDYDIKSILHGASYSPFAINVNLPVMKSKNSDAELNAYQYGNRMTDKDIAIVQAIYG